MIGTDSKIVLGSLVKSENVRKFLDGSTRSNIMLRSAVLGLGTYHSGWKWSLHAGAQVGKSSENHIGYILSGRMMVRDSAGIEKEVGPGDAFEVGLGHDAWVIGSESCTALDFIHISQ
jgi:uncharacterized cupin superfamily protein